MVIATTTNQIVHPENWMHKHEESFAYLRIPGNIERVYSNSRSPVPRVNTDLYCSNARRNYAGGYYGQARSVLRKYGEQKMEGAICCDFISNNKANLYGLTVVSFLPSQEYSDYGYVPPGKGVVSGLWKGWHRGVGAIAVGGVDGYKLIRFRVLGDEPPLMIDSFVQGVVRLDNKRKLILESWIHG